MIAIIILISNGMKTTWKRKNNIRCWNKEILLYLFCKYSWVL